MISLVWLIAFQIDSTGGWFLLLLHGKDMYRSWWPQNFAFHVSRVNRSSLRLRLEAPFLHLGQHLYILSMYFVRIDNLTTWHVKVLFALSADVFPPSQRTLISGALNAAGNIGAALGGLMRLSCDSATVSTVSAFVATRESLNRFCLPLRPAFRSGVVGPTYGCSCWKWKRLAFKNKSWKWAIYWISFVPKKENIKKFLNKQLLCFFIFCHIPRLETAVHHHRHTDVSLCSFGSSLPIWSTHTAEGTSQMWKSCKRSCWVILQPSSQFPGKSSSDRQSDWKLYMLVSIWSIVQNLVQSWVTPVH